MQVLQFFANAACSFAVEAVVVTLWTLPRAQRRRGTLSARPPRYVGRHDPRRPQLGVRPEPGTERASLALDADRHPGWALTGVEGPLDPALVLAHEQQEGRGEVEEGPLGQTAEGGER